MSGGGECPTLPPESTHTHTHKPSLPPLLKQYVNDILYNTEEVDQSNLTYGIEQMPT